MRRLPPVADKVTKTPVLDETAKQPFTSTTGSTAATDVEDVKKFIS